MVHRRVFKSKWLLILPLLAVLIMAVACGDGDAPTPLVIEKEVVVEKEVVKEVVVVATPTPGKAPAAMTPTNTLGVAVFACSKESLDMAFSDTSTKACTGEMFDFLIGTAGNGDLTGKRGLAESWEVGPDGSSLKLNLRKGVKWHDGAPFTSDDVLFTIGERYLAEEAICVFCRQLKVQVDEVVPVDTHTVDIRLKSPDITFFATLSNRDADIAILPRQNFKANADGTFQLQGDPIGTGFMKFVKRTAGQSYTYEANLDYWSTDYPPDWAGMRLTIVPEATVRLASLRAEEVDLAKINTDQVAQLKQAGLRLGGYEGGGTFAITFNKSFDPKWIYNNLEFRKALALAIDMDALVEALFTEGTYVRASTAFWNLSAVVGYDPGLKPYPYDPEEAKKALKASGYDGTKLKIWPFVQTSWCVPCLDILEIAQGYWEEIGVKTEMAPIEWAGFSKKIFSIPPDLGDQFAGHISMDAAPGRPLGVQNVRNSWASKDVGGRFEAFHDAEGADAVYQAAGSVSSMEELQKLLQDFNKKSYAEYPSIPIVQTNATWGLGPRIESWDPADLAVAGFHFETARQKR